MTRPAVADREPRRRVAATILGALVAMLAIAGAAGLPARAATAAPAPELRAYVNERCVVADEPWYRPEAEGGAEQRSLTLLGIVVSKLAGIFMQQAIGAAAARLQARGARQDTRYAVATQSSLYVAEVVPSPSIRLDGNLGCLTVVAGRFAADGTDCRADYVPRTVAPETATEPVERWRTDRGDDSAANPLRRANICATDVAAVYEARFEFSPDGTAWRLRDAGHRVERLLSTDRKGAERSVYYTLEVRAPGRSREPELLSGAWVDLGRLAAGSRGAGQQGADPPWLRVPPPSEEARRHFDRETAVHQENAAQIDALQRAIARNESVRATLEKRRRGAPAALARSLRDEIVRTQTQGLTLQAELEARRAEYAALDPDPIALMPVTIEVGVTETASERKALQGLATIIDGQREFIATTALTAAAGLIARRSIDAAEAPASAARTAGTPPATATGIGAGTATATAKDALPIVLAAGDAARAELEAARTAYYDALVEAQLRPAGAASADDTLRRARERYDAARRGTGTAPAPSNAP